MAEFLSWQVSQLRSFGAGPVVSGRLQAKAPISLQEVLTGATNGATGPFELFGPGDVTRLSPGVVSRRYPAPGAHDAEETKRALVEFAGADLLDLPWRYSPEPAGSNGIRPWLVLVVGEPGEVGVWRDGTVTLTAAAQARHPLGQSKLWAHVHKVDGQQVARILSAVDLAPATAYVACLVPAFVVETDGTLRDAWPMAGGAPVRLPCYDSWSFRTGEKGDFPELAARLKAVTPAALGDTFGRAAVRYDRRGSGDPGSAQLSTEGALRRPGADAGAMPVEPWIAGEIAALADDLPTPDGRWVLTAPRYHQPFTTPGAAATAGWSGALNTDPRRRGMAGLGAWASIAWQERIASAAATKAGDLAIARDRVGHLALGLEAARALWRRHVPQDSAGRLAVLAPVLGRLPAQDGGTVLDQIAGRTPLMARALWSSAARRALRPGPARTALAEPGAGRFESVIAHAAQCPDPQPDPDEVPIKERSRRDAQLGAAKDAIYQAARGDDRLAAQVADQLLGGKTLPDPARLAVVLAALDPGGGKAPDLRRLIVLLRWPGEEEFDPGDLIDLVETLGGLAGKPVPCRGFAPENLGEAVAAAVDPTVARPLVVDRVLGTLDGVHDIGPIEIEPELDLPLWRFLADDAPDWLLPGIGDLPDDRVVALETNSAFVETFLVGANHQTLGELRWRNLPIASRWSPLRKFWQRAGGRLDIAPIRQWPAAADFGMPPLAATGIAGTEAVVVFRTTLFRRYPGTVVYLYRDTDWVPPPAGQPLAEADKRYPTFTGTIGADVTFFGFPVPAEELAHYWVVLEEPPSGYRFYSTKQQNGVPVPVPAGGAASGADFAVKTFAVPVRVMIGRLLGGA